MIRSLQLPGLLAGSLGPSSSSVAALSTTPALHKNKAGKYKASLRFHILYLTSYCSR